MSRLFRQADNSNLLPIIESARFFCTRLKQLDIFLLAETVLVTIVSIFAVAVLSSSNLVGNNWFIIPAILLSAAIFPTVIFKRNFSEFGLSFKQIKNPLTVLGWTCVIVLPSTFFGVWLLKSCGLYLPLRPMLLEEQNWVSWLLFQFMYVAVAEEVFFRGYVQGNILRLANTIKLEQNRLHRSSSFQSFGNGVWLSIILSAACFATAHVIIQGQIASLLTFLPGLILGWLFVRTKSLLAPILFHGLANTCYLLTAVVFT